MFEKMFDIITFGSATQDLILKPKNVTSLHYEKTQTQKEVCFPMGSKIEIEDILFNSGGGGTNTAATFALQGFETGFCGTLGADVSGEEIINELKKLNVNTNLVQKTEEKRTNHSVVILNSGQDRTIMAYRGAADIMKEIPFNKLKTKWLYLAPLAGQLCLPAGRQATTPFEDIVNFAVSEKIKIATNPSMAQLSLRNFAEIAKKIDVLIMNQEEASFLTKIPYEQEHEIFKKIDAMCPGVLIMTKGGAGVTVSDNVYLYSAMPPADRKIVDTTGAGDAFGSGFVAEFMRSGNIEAAVQLGMANSLGCISEVGAKNGLLKKGDDFKKIQVIKSNK